MPPSQKRELQLRADAVGRRDEDGILVAPQRVSAAEAADIGKHRRREGFARQRPDRSDRAIRFVNIHSGVFVRHTPLRLSHRISMLALRRGLYTDERCTLVSREARRSTMKAIWLLMASA